MKLAALVPMRHHSQRVPGKNYHPLAGKPLFHHILETLLAVPEIQTVMMGINSKPVMDGMHRFFPTVKLIQRPAHLRADDVLMCSLRSNLSEVRRDSSASKELGSVHSLGSFVLMFYKFTIDRNSNA